MIVLVTGGRDFVGRDRLWTALDRLHAKPGHLILGDARGADRIAYEWWQRRGRYVPCSCGRHIARWSTLGAGAGPERNGRMVAEAAALAKRGADVLVLACPGGAGTADCVRQARASGLRVVTLDEALAAQAEVRP